MVLSDHRGESSPLSRKRLTRLLSALRPGEPGSRGLPETLTGRGRARRPRPHGRPSWSAGPTSASGRPGFASPLVAACTAGQLEAVRFLLERGAVLRPPDAVVTPVQAAVMNGHVRGGSGPARGGGDPGRGRGRSAGRLRLGLLSGGGAPGGRRPGPRPPASRRAVAARARGRRRAPRGPPRPRVLPAQPAGGSRGDAHRPHRPRRAPGAAGPPGQGPGRGTARRVPRSARSASRRRWTAVHSAGEGASSWTTDDGEPLLAVAAGHGLREIVEALLAVGADPGAAAAHSLVTPLIRAAEGGHTRGRAPPPRPRAPTRTHGMPRAGAHWLAAAPSTATPSCVRVLLSGRGRSGAHGRRRTRPRPRALRGPFVREIQELAAQGGAARRPAAAPRGPSPPRSGRPPA